MNVEFGGLFTFKCASVSHGSFHFPDPTPSCCYVDAVGQIDFYSIPGVQPDIDAPC